MKFAIALLMVFTALGCSDVIDKEPNVDPNGGPGPEGAVEIGNFSNGSYQTLSDGDDVEIISGFQGGWHVDAVLHVDNIPREDLTGSVSFTVAVDDVTVARSGEQELRPDFFSEEGGNLIYFSFPVIFDDEPFGYEGEVVQLQATGTLAGDALELETDITLVNETDEFEGMLGIRR